jgi:DNA-binding NtrC family response regulator
MQQIVIVRRDKYATFGLLAQAFADEPNVRLVWDRRVRDRRRDAAAADSTDRRRSDRRRDASTTWGSHDYLLLNTRATAATTAPANATTVSDINAVERPGTSDEVRRDIEIAVASELSVLISGGDVLSRRSLAHRIHRRSDRRERPLVVVDPAAFSEATVPGSGSSQAAWVSAGAMLIEELADLNLAQQAQLWLMLEHDALQRSNPRGDPSRHVRIISGTRHEMLERVAAKQFRADLFYRLNVVHLVLPAGSVQMLD